MIKKITHCQNYEIVSQLDGKNWTCCKMDKKIPFLSLSSTLVHFFPNLLTIKT